MKSSRRVMPGWGTVLRVLGFALLAGLGAAAAAESEPSVDSVLNAARKLAADGRMEEAIVMVENRLAALTHAVDRASARELLGDLHQRTRTHSGLTNAIGHYEAALALAPELAPVYLKQARLQLMLPEHHSRALAALQKYFGLGKTNPEALYLLGSLHKFAAEHATNSQASRREALAALEAYQGVLRLDTNHVPALGNIADIAFNLGMYPAAAALYEQLIQHPIEPERRLPAMTRLAHSQTRLRHFARADALLDEAGSGLAKIPAAKDPVVNASLQIERVRVLAYRMENRLAAGDAPGALLPGQELLNRVAELRKEFTSPELIRWEQAAQGLAESSRR